MPHRPLPKILLASLLLALLALIPATAHAAAPSAQAAVVGPAGARHRAGEVVVRFAAGTSARRRAAVARAAGAGLPRAFAPHSRVLTIRDGRSVAAAVAALRARPEVSSAAPNVVARASYIPDDPGAAGVPGGWQAQQWNFGAAPAGIDMPTAWDHMIALGRQGGRGTVVAVLDTGVAYSNRGRFRISPDFKPSRFVRGHDFVDDDDYANDENGHGTHVASTLGADTGEKVGLTGIAYGAKIMPVRVLDRVGEGDSAAIASGIRYAARKGADVINLSFEFGTAVTRSEIPEILSALAYARHRGVLVVGAAGNAAATTIAYPARASNVLSVGATTQHGCRADYSNSGSRLDIMGPGGGGDAAVTGDALCQPTGTPGGPISQLTFTTSVRSFGYPTDYIGTSMATPHVAGVAALVIASGLLGKDPAPTAVIARLKATAVDLGTPGPDSAFGAGLVNAAAATDPADTRGR